MQNTPRGNRLHIALFGRRNAGKSSLINALTNQPLAIVSDIPGTTTDPVYKAMELLPIGPVMLIDTAGLDDTGELGELRVKKSLEVLGKTDLVVLVTDAEHTVGELEHSILTRCQEKQLPVLVVLNKSDLLPVPSQIVENISVMPAVCAVMTVSAQTGSGVYDLKMALVKHAPTDWDNVPLAGDLFAPGETAVLVVPIDKAAPKGRLILPQVQVIRDLLDHGVLSYVVRETELTACLEALRTPPKMVITDSQAFGKVSQDTPPDILLTSFSILFARHKGDLATLVKGARSIAALRPGDKVLISEACTHHRVEDDIGTVKLPRWLNQHIGGELAFAWSSGYSFPENLEQYKLIIHCGSCMINRRETLSRIVQAEQASVPITNYGVAIAYLHGILERALSPFEALGRI